MKKFLPTIILFLIGVPIIAGATMYEYYQEQGLNLPPVAERQEDAINCGIEDYIGTASQNEELEACLRGELEFGAIIPDIKALYEDNLQAKITSSQTTLTLVDGADKEGNNLSGTYGFIIDEGSSDEEFVLCTCAATACSSCQRGLDVTTGQSEITALKKSHRRGASIKITDFPILGILRQILTGAATTPGILQYASSTSIGLMGDNVLVTKKYSDDVGAGGFTASNIGDGKTLRANGTSPETMDINTSTAKLWFTTDNGYFEVASSTVSELYAFWNDRYNATTTKNLAFTFSDDLAVTGDLNVAGDLNVTGTILNNGVVKNFTCGETITANKALYGSATSSRVLLADDDLSATSTINFVGLSLGACDAEGTVAVQTNGIFTDTSANYTTSTPIYISDDGALAEASGTYEGIIGQAINSTQINMGASFGMQYISSASDSSDVIDVPDQARFAVINVTFTDGTSTQNEQMFLSRVGLSTGTVTSYPGTTSPYHSGVTGVWSGSEITLTAVLPATAVSGTAYFYR